MYDKVSKVSTSKYIWWLKKTPRSKFVIFSHFFLKISYFLHTHSIILGKHTDRDNIFNIIIFAL